MKIYPATRRCIHRPALHVVMMMVLALLAAAPASALAQALKLPSIFSSHMVLQQSKPAHFRGWATPDTHISLTLLDKTYTSQSNAQGKWQITTDLLPAADEQPHPFAVVIKQETPEAATLTLDDVLLGEVWLCSGQSNMEMALSQTMDGKAVASKADHPQIRLFTTTRFAAATPQDDLTGTWTTCTPGSAARFSAAGYYFGVMLQQHLNVPIGLIHSSWGGTNIYSWTSSDALPEANQAKARQEQQAARDLQTEVTRDDATWAEPSFDDSDWTKLWLPTYFDYALYPGEYNGVVWARKTITIPPQWEGKALSLHLGAVDDYETTFYNGKQVGQTTSHTRVVREYQVPAELVKQGSATIAVRVTKIGWGGIFGPAAAMKIFPTGTEADTNTDTDENNKPIALASHWKYQASQLKLMNISPRLPSSLFNAMINPLFPMNMRGVLWYQGEADAHGTNAYDYRQVLTGMIQNWRIHFKQNDLAFGVVQLTSFTPPTGNPNTVSPWAMLRESQAVAVSQTPGTGLAVTLDVGEAGDIHPKNKADIGDRLARWALAQIYHKPIAFQGPQYQSMEIQGDKIVLTFKPSQAKLASRDGELQHFAIAGDDRKFHWAKATIQNNTVSVSSSDVPSPVAVRYGWATNALTANLVNTDNLPAGPFRTDNW